MTDADEEGYGDANSREGIDVEKQNPSSSHPSIDGDYDEVLTDDDCDDSNPILLAQSNAFDCDGVLQPG